MTQDEFKNLKEGDIVTSRVDGLAYIVHSNFGNHVVAIRTADIAHPEEWKLEYTATHVRLVGK